MGLTGLPGLIGHQAPSRFPLQELGPLSENLEVQQPFAVPMLSPLPQYSLFGEQVRPSFLKSTSYQMVRHMLSMV